MSPPGLSRRVPFRLLQRVVPTARTRIGRHTVRVPTHSPAAINWLHWRPTWKSAALRALLGPRTGAFVDIGANTGQTLADFLAAGTPHAYVGLEPNPAACAFVSEVAALNAFSSVAVLPVAAAATAVVRALYVLEHDPIDCTASLRAELRRDCPRRPLWVNTAPLDQLLAATGHEHVALVKIDVEGAELDVLRGAERLLREERPPVLCEVLLADGDADAAAHRDRMRELEDFLRQHRYRALQLEKTHAANLPRLRACAEFPSGAWSHARAEECDYLFVPDEHPPVGFESARS